MTVNEFCKLLQDEFKETSEVTPESHFKEFANYGSLSAVLMLQLVEDRFGVKLNPRGFRNINTVNDLVDAIGEQNFD